MNALNTKGDLRFFVPQAGKAQKPLKSLKTPCQKIFLLIQEAFIPANSTLDHALRFEREEFLKTGPRIIGAAARYFLYSKQFAAAANCLILSKALVHRLWPDTDHQCRQIPGVGHVISSRLKKGGLAKIDQLEEATIQSIETAAIQKYPFGSRIKSELKKLPPKIDLRLDFLPHQHQLEVCISLSSNDQQQQPTTPSEAWLLVGCTATDSLVYSENLKLDSMPQPYVKTICVVDAIKNQGDEKALYVAAFITSKNFGRDVNKVVTVSRRDCKIRKVSSGPKQNNQSERKVDLHQEEIKPTPPSQEIRTSKLPAEFSLKRFFAPNKFVWQREQISVAKGKDVITEGKGGKRKTAENTSVIPKEALLHPEPLPPRNNNIPAGTMNPNEDLNQSNEELLTHTDQIYDKPNAKGTTNIHHFDDFGMMPGNKFLPKGWSTDGDCRKHKNQQTAYEFPEQGALSLQNQESIHAHVGTNKLLHHGSINQNNSMGSHTAKDLGWFTPGSHPPGKRKFEQLSPCDETNKDPRGQTNPFKDYLFRTNTYAMSPTQPNQLADKADNADLINEAVPETVPFHELSSMGGGFFDIDIF